MCVAWSWGILHVTVTFLPYSTSSGDNENFIGFSVNFASEWAELSYEGNGDVREGVWVSVCVWVSERVRESGKWSNHSQQMLPTSQTRLSRGRG